MKKQQKSKLLAILSIVMAVVITGCSSGSAPTQEQPPQQTQTDSPDNAPDDTPMEIYMYGTLDESYIPFLNALAEQFPEVDLKYEFQWDFAGVKETERRIQYGDGPDIAIVDGTALASLTEKNYLLDLSDAPFSTNYHVSTMTKLNDQGRVLGLPLPNDLRCLVCNLDILEENGITELPKTIEELSAICQTLTERGQKALIADEQVYLMLLRTDYLCKPAGYDWLLQYNSGEATMAGTPAEEAWERFVELAKVSGYTPEDAASTPARMTELMISGEYAFRNVTMTNLKFMTESAPNMNFAALPLLGETEEDQWAFYAEQRNMRYFVANGTLDEPENAAKKEKVLEILDWVSTEQTQQILATCGSAAISYVNDVNLDQGEILKHMDSAIQKGHLTSSEAFERGVGDVLRSCTVQIVDGKMTAADAVNFCDTTNKEYIESGDEPGLDEVIGKATAPIYWRKVAAVTVGSPMTQLGALAMAEAFPDADFAFAMAKNMASTLYPGDITMEDAIACTDGEGDRELMLVEATGAQIKDLIDAGVGSPTEANFVIPYGVAGKGRLLHPTGLTYKADITRENGDKITELKLADGSELDLEKTYTIIVSGLLIDGVTEPNLKECLATPTGKRLKDVFVDYIRNHNEVSPPELNFEIIGANPIYTTP